MYKRIVLFFMFLGFAFGAVTLEGENPVRQHSDLIVLHLSLYCVPENRPKVFLMHAVRQPRARLSVNGRNCAFGRKYSYPGSVPPF